MRYYGASHLSDNRDYEVQRQNHFEVQITELGEDFSLAVESFPLPTESSEVQEISYGNTSVKFVGKTSWDNGTLVVRDFIGKDIEQKVIDWRKKVYDPDTDRIGYMSDYKKLGYVREYSPDGEIVRVWKLYGCWPSSVSFGDLSHESSGRKNITITIAYDKAVRIS